MIETGRVDMIPIELIIVEDRARQEMGDLTSLEENMKSTGLISPLAVMENSDGTFRLLAGERRFRVLSKNGADRIPVRVYERELSDLEMKIVEKSENFHRKDMEYFELDKLTLEIDKLGKEQFGTKAPGPGGEGWGTKEMAELFGVKAQSTITDSLKRAEVRELFPQLFEGCKTASDASKIIKKMDEAVLKQAIAQKLESQRTDSSIHQLAKCYIIQDFFEGAKKIPDGIMHLVEIDPPYAIDLQSIKKKDGESLYHLENYNEISKANYPVFLTNLLRECYRVMADHSWLICWFAPEPWFELIYQAITLAGFNTSRMCGIWTKGIPGQNMNPQTRLSNSYEMFFYAWKGSPALNKPGRSNEFHFSPVSPQQKVHPTERPIELMEEIYDTFAFTGSRVLIPFLGSGNGILAADQLGMSPVGFELSREYRDSFLVKAHLMKGGL